MTVQTGWSPRSGMEAEAETAELPAPTSRAARLEGPFHGVSVVIVT